MTFSLSVSFQSNLFFYKFSLGSGGGVRGVL